MKQNMKYAAFSILSIPFFFALFLSTSCENTCTMYVEKYHRNLNLHFCLSEKKEKDRYFIFIGTNSSGQTEIFESEGWSDMYKMAEIGDSIRKDSTKNNILLIKHDTVINYPCYCNGRVYE
jgi:hypothetical protein